MVKKKRIEWVDVVKGMAVPLIILGHTAQSQLIISYVYSFHMPLFFLLSGYTSSRATNWKTFGKHILKDFCYLIIPCILVQIGIETVDLWIKVDGFKFLNWMKIRGILYRMYWGCAWGWASGFPSVGMLWFFFTMFWSKVIWEGIGLLFPKKDTAICIFVSLIGIWIGFEHYVPQNLDIAMMVVLYYCVGHLVRKYQDAELLQKIKMPAFWVALCFWVFCAQRGIYIELAIESYPGIVTAILESLCGSYVFCILAQEVTENTFCKKLFSFLGKHTLLIVLVHHADSLLQSVWMQKNWVISYVCRGILVIAISAVIVALQSATKLGLANLRKKKAIAAARDTIKG